MQEFSKDYTQLGSRNRILHYIYEKQQVTRQTMTKDLALSLPTVLQNVNNLIAEGLVIETGRIDALNGRKAKILEGVLDRAFALGIDISKNHIAFLCTDLYANILCFHRIRLQFVNNTEYYRTVGFELDRFIETQQISRPKIIGVGISMPASISKDGEHTRSTQMLLPDSISLNFFKQYIPYPCCFVNDAKAAATAEFYKYETRSANTVYLLLSSGVGGAVIVNNELYMGDTFTSGEFGHMILVPNGRKCYCGAAGCAQMYVNSRILSSETDDNLDDFFAKLGSDKRLDEVWDAYLTSLSLLVFNLHMLFDCTVILGGYVGGYIEQYLSQLSLKLKALNPANSDFSYVQAGHLKMEASALGAALVYVKTFLDEA